MFIEQSIAVYCYDSMYFNKQVNTQITSKVVFWYCTSNVDSHWLFTAKEGGTTVLHDLQKHSAGV